MPQLFVGSEGTLGIVTEITLKLVSLPRHRRTLLAPFDSIERAAAAVPAIMAAGVVPCALEFLEQDCLKAIEAHRGIRVRFSDRAAVLLIEVDGNHEAALDAEIEIIAEVLEAVQRRRLFHRRKQRAANGNLGHPPQRRRSRQVHLRV